MKVLGFIIYVYRSVWRTTRAATASSTTTMAASSNTALKTFSLANDIVNVSPQDEIYQFDQAANRRLLQEAPWAREYVRTLCMVWTSSLTMFPQPTLLQGVQNICSCTYQDGENQSTRSMSLLIRCSGHPRPLRCAIRNYGPHAREGHGSHPRYRRLLRPARAGH